ncbi:MAG: hypothetical protein JW388_1315 [Nitrospira sp.]|nr:hypothetical protein [Nitrospira sp.]
MRRIQIQLRQWQTRNLRSFIERMSHAIDHAAQKFVAHWHAQRMSRGHHFCARTNTVHFAQRHQEQFLVTETHHFCQ